MQLHDIKPTNRRKKKKRIGRGGKRGTYSGKGMKGQKSRAGRKMRPELRDFIKKIPKKRGYRFKAKSKPQIVNLRDIENKFTEKEIINPETLYKKGLIDKVNNKGVKILGEGKISKKFKVIDCLFSKSAAKALGIEKKSLYNKKTNKKESPKKKKNLKEKISKKDKKV